MKRLISNEASLFICMLTMIVTVFMDYLVGTVALGFLSVINTMTILKDK